jgi:hypothetical protein
VPIDANCYCLAAFASPSPLTQPTAADFFFGPISVTIPIHKRAPGRKRHANGY